jgi:hypothetical protein
MKRFYLKFISFEKENFPKLALLNSKTSQLIYFDFPDPYLLSFQTIQYDHLEKNYSSQHAIFLDVYERKAGGTFQGHFFGTIVRNVLKMNFKYFVPQHHLLNEVAKNEQIGIDRFERYHSYKFALETLRHHKGLGTILFNLGALAARRLYQTEFILIDLVEIYRPFYLKRFAELGIKAMPGSKNGELYGRWID